MRIFFVGNIGSVHLQKWVNAFKNKGNEIFVVSKKSFENIKGVKIYNVLEDNIFFNIKGTRRFTCRIKPLIAKIFYSFILKNVNPDILHIHQLTSYYPLDFALLNFKPLVISVWGSDVLGSYENLSPEIKQKIILALQKADAITATSKFLAKRTKKLVPEKEIEVVPFGVDLKKFSPQSKNKTSKVITIGFIKHLKPQYGPDYLIEAFTRVCKKYSNINLLILGEGPLEKELKNLVKKLKIDDKVEFLGFVPNDLVPKYLSKMDIFVMPSLMESFGVAALEASAMEVPVVASRVGGVPEVLKDGKTGLLVEPKNVNELTAAIIKLIKDPGLRKKMGIEGRKFVKENYNWQKNTQQMENLYKSLL